MRLIRGIHNIRHEHGGCALTIGNFDGVHLGHQQVIQQLLEKARELHVESAVMVFEPQPMEFFAGAKAPARISSFRDKYRMFESLGVDKLIVVRFCQQFAALHADTFISQLLVQQLQIRHLVIGDDFRFGANRNGDFKLLMQAGAQFGFGVQNTQSFCLAEKRISSTLIRQALSESRFEDVRRWLGRPYRIQGHVTHGQKLGRQLGFPTANLHMPRGRSPMRGVFAVEVVSADGSAVHWPAVANVGYRPTANGHDLLLEVHVLDRKESLYGQRLVVEPRLKLRDEVKFDSLDALQTQVHADMQRARIWFNSQNNSTGTVDR